MYGLMPMLGAKQVAAAAAASCGGLATVNATYFEASDAEHLDSTWAIPDSNVFTISLWIKRAATGSARGIIYAGNGSNDQFRLYMSVTGNVIIAAKDSAGTLVLGVAGSTVGITDTNWHHLYVTFDNSAATSPNLAYIYIDGVNRTPSWTWVNNNPVDFEDASTPVMRIAMRRPGNTEYLDACLAEVWMKTEYLDPATYIPKFRDAATGKPLDLSADGSCPTGAQPEIYLKDSASTFNVNYGSLGNFTFQYTTDTPVACGSSPSD